MKGALHKAADFRVRETRHNPEATKWHTYSIARFSTSHPADALARGIPEQFCVTSGSAFQNPLAAQVDRLGLACPSKSENPLLPCLFARSFIMF
jgi:hypothetical protein